MSCYIFLEHISFVYTMIIINFKLAIPNYPDISSRKTLSFGQFRLKFIHSLTILFTIRKINLKHIVVVT